MNMSIVIPAYNEEAYLDECLRSILEDVEKTKEYGPLEVLVIDNGSTDRTSEIAKSFPGVRVAHEPDKGLTKARQRGLIEAKGDILAFVDADTRMPNGWIRKVLGTFEAVPGTVCVSGPYIYYDLPQFSQMLVRIYWRALALPVYGLTGYMVVGGNFAARREALTGIGGFDTTIAFYGEDTEIARRLSKIGKVRFLMDLEMHTSARRLRADGFLTTGAIYALNFMSEVILKRPATTSYRDIR